MSAPNTNLVSLINAFLVPSAAWADPSRRQSLRNKPEDGPIDMTPYIMEMYYYENILSPIITAKVVLRNSNPNRKLSNMFPVTDGDRVLISFDADRGQVDQLSGSTIDETFVTFAIRKFGVRSSPVGLEILTIELMSTWSDVYDAAQANLPAPGVKEGTTSNIINQMYKDIFNYPQVKQYNPGKANGIRYIHPSITNQSYGWNGLQKADEFLNFGLYLARNSSYNDKQAGFLFFESRSGHSFVSIDKLIDDAKKAYKAGDKNIETYRYNGINQGAVEGDNQTVLYLKGYSSDGFYLKQTRVDAGIRQFAYDPITGQAYVIFLSEEDAQKERSTTNPEEIVLKNGSLPRSQPYTGRAIDLGLINRDDKDLCKIENSFLLSDMRAISRYNSLYSVQVNATVKLNINLEVGEFVYLEIPEKIAKEECIAQDEINWESKESNLYMVAALCHAVGTDKGYTSLLLVRDKPKKQQN
jgi:hypothetical protein